MDLSSIHSDSSLFRFLPKTKRLSNMQKVCINALCQMGEVVCGYMDQPSVFTMPHARFYSFDPNSFYIGRDESSGKWEWSIKIAAGSLEMEPDISVDLGGKRTDDRMRSLRHDIVCTVINSDETDIPLAKIFPELEHMETGKLTPDFHISYCGVNYIIEIGTSRAAEPTAAKFDLRKKAHKYGPVLEDLTHDQPCLLIIIIVGLTYVVSNYEIPEAIQEELILHMNLALGMELRITGLNLPNLMASLDGQAEILHEQIKFQIQSLNVEDCPNTDLNITPSFIKSLETPADKEKVMRYFTREIRKTTANVASKLKTEKPVVDKRLKEFEDLLRGQETKDYVKAITAMPLFVVPRAEEFDATMPTYVVISTDKGEVPPVLDLWQEALTSYCNTFINFDEKLELTKSELYYTDPNDQEEVTKKSKESRRLAHRCRLDRSLSDETLRHLAMDGVWGKRWLNDPEKQEKERRKTLSFNLDTDLTDVEEFTRNADIYEEYEYSTHGSLPMELLEDSMDKLDQKKEALTAVKMLQGTKLMCALEITSAIAMELTVSLKQHTSSREVLVKKLAFYDIYILIVPTKASEHIFYSLYVPGQEGLEILAGLPFRECLPAFEGGFYTEFCSFRPDKLSNHATIASSFIGMASYFAYHYNLKDPSPSELLKSREAICMLNTALLIRLENKLTTEETITVSRYMYMEVLKSHCCIMPDPLRLISKLPTKIRSRLQLFVTKKLITAFTIMDERPARRIDPEVDRQEMDMEEDVPSNDHWRFLINPFTLTEEKHASRVVSLFYLGYAVDKDQTAQANSDFKIIEKAIRKDLEFDVKQSHKSNGTWDDFDDTPGEMQFSVNVIKWGSERMQKDLMGRYGAEYKETMGNLVLQRLAKHMTHELATLKASARIEHLDWDQLPSADAILKDRKARLKVIEALILELEIFEYNPYLRLSEMVTIVEKSSRGVISDLFKKNQHGGLREIYVLTIKSKLLALFLETCSRCLCEQFTVETMTHPDCKMEVIERHKMQVNTLAAKTKRSFNSYQCSADKKSWNNNLVMPALSIPLLMLLPKAFHGAIQRTLNMWNQRLIQLPRGVLKLLTAGVELSDPTYQLMMKEFESPGSTGDSPLFPNAGSGYCILHRGMMQGILHYTSSLLHVNYLFVTRELIRSAYKAKFPDTTFLIDQMCSSDDSATIMSVVHPLNESEQGIKVISAFSEIICEVLKTFCRYSCFTNSEKSVMGSLNQLEFNSEFIIGNNMAVPILKWVFSAFGVSESENLLHRQQTLYNLMSQVSASGLPSFNVTIIQIAQGLLHYKLLGSETNPHFKIYYDEIMKYPDPTLGFFVIDSIYCPGILGFSYHHWLHCKVSNLFIIRKKSVIDGSLGFNPEGGLVETFLVRHGDSRRYKQLIETISDGKEVGEVRDLVNANPLVLYSDSKSREDAEIKILAKALLPGTAQSLTRGVPFLQAVATSIYGLQTYAYTRTDATYSEGKGERTHNKISLIGEIYRRRTSVVGANLSLGQTAESLCFPNYTRYQEYLLVLRKYKDAREVQVTSMRHRKSRLTFSQATSSIALSLYDLVKEKWAGKATSHSMQLKQRCWAEYQSVMPWLHDSIERTLDESPFLDHVELHNFVGSASKRSRTVMKVGPAIRSSYPIGQVDQLARRSYKDGKVLVLKDAIKSTGYQAYRDRRTAIGLALEIPNEAQRELMLKLATNHHRVYKEELTSLRDRTRREAILSIIVAYFNGEPNDVIQKAIEDFGNGLFISWAQEQKKISTYDLRPKTVWVGEGLLVLSNRDLVCRVKVADQRAISIVTNSIKLVRLFSNQIVRALKEQDIYLNNLTSTRMGQNFLTRTGVNLSGPGTVIVEAVNNPSVTPPDNWNLRFTHRIKHGEVSLLQQGAGFMPTTILTYRALPQEFDSSQDVRIMKQVWECWYYQATLDKDVAMSLIISTIHRAMDRTVLPGTKDHIESTAMIKFLRDTLQARLRQKGYASNIGVKGVMLPGMEHEEEEVEMTEAMRNLLDQFDNYLLTDDNDAPAVGDLLRVQVEIAEEATGNLQDDLDILVEISNFQTMFTEQQIKAEPTEFVSARLTTRYGLMQFWDDLIAEVNRVNPRAWSQLLKGYRVAGITNSDSLIGLLLDRKGLPANVFGIDIDREVDEEAMIAVYASSSRPASSRRSSTTFLKEKFIGTFTTTAEEILSQSEHFKGKEDLIKEVMKVIGQATKKAEEVSVVNSDSEDEEEFLPAGTDASVKKVESWMSLTDGYGPGESYQSEDPLLSSDEINWLYNILKGMGGIDQGVTSNPAATINYLKGTVPLESEFNNFDLEQKNAFFCHLGDSDNGHWVSFAAGVRFDGRLEFFDSLYSDEHLQQALDQLRNIFPEITLSDVCVRDVRRQTSQSCGHTSFLMTSHRLLGYNLPSSYSDDDVREWVVRCIRTRTIKPLQASKYF
uniref:RNA-dependent RNA polymerase-like protein n=1 Tax=uncultured virus TaxID=340016 RepID=V5KE43_9VIRU|nr:RNA-dependent RNA polymerase-like protein [uncultured virus]